MDTTIKEQFGALKGEVILRAKGIEKYKKILVSKYYALVVANGLDEVRDMNISILRSSAKNRHLISLINEVLNSGSKVMTSLDVNTVVLENLSCAKEFRTLVIAMDQIRSAKTEDVVRVLNLNAILRPGI
ncbi:hypothetical protein [Cellulophaga sp. Z1A5H]|uniref:hypothetical protein n=1 Tax=Cellulophaga sp. Z1A5H TaxID=2687291 RepID=UPI0013FE3B3A|nr:hypothetical protein [Cellulophaga sp. Z1A5H]